MRKIISLALCCFVLFTNAQNLKPFKAANGLWGYKDAQFDDIVIQPKYNSAEEFSEGLAMVSVFSFTTSHRFGFVDKTGKEIIPLKYIKADKFSEGLALIKTDLGKISFIDKTGKEVIKTIYTDARSFSGGLAAVMLVKQMGFINKNGETVIPLIYDAANDFIDDYTIASLNDVTVQIDKTGKELPMLSEYGYVDRLQKKVVIEPINFEAGYGFSAEGIAVVISQKTGLSGAINKNGKLVIPIKYKQISRLINGLYSVNENGKYGLIDKTGRVLIAPKFKSIFSRTNKLLIATTDNNEYVFIDKNGLEVTPYLTDFWEFEGDLATVKKQGKYGAINGDGKLVIPINYNTVYTNKNNIVEVILNNKHGLLNTDGTVIVEAKYDEIDHYVNGKARVELNKKYGFVNKEGKEIIPIKYNSANDFYKNICVVKEGYKWGVINSNGKYMVQPKYDYIKSFNDDLAVVEMNDKFGFIDLAGKQVIPLSFSTAESFVEGIALVGKFGKYGFINKKGEYIFEKKFDEAKSFNNGIALVKIGDVWGCISKDGKFVIQPRYNDIGYISENKFAVKEKGKWGYITLQGKAITNFEYQSVAEFSEGLAAVSYYDLGNYFYIDSTGKRAINGPFRLADKFRNGKAHVVTLDLKHEYINKKGETEVRYSNNIQGENMLVSFKKINSNPTNTTSKKLNVTPADKKLNYSFTKYYAYTRVSGFNNFVESNYKVVVNRDFIQVYIESNRGIYTLWNEYKIVASDEMKEPGQAPDMAYLSSNDKLLLFIRKEGRDVLRIGNRSGDSYTEYISNKN